MPKIRSVDDGEQRASMLNKLWNDPETGLTSLTQFHNTVKQHGIKISMKELKNWYQEQSVNQITKRVKRNESEFYPIQSPQHVDCLQADLMDISKYAQSNSNFNFLFNVLHLDTRFVWSFPIKQKTPQPIAQHLATVIRLVKQRSPSNEITVTTDNGTEFKGAVASLLRENAIKHYTSVDTNNTANIERFHRTLWGYINKCATANNTLKFIDVLPKLITKYNNATNRMLHSSPQQLWRKPAEHPEQRPKPATRLKIGDRVRFQTNLQKFDKRSFLNRFSTGIFTITAKNGNKFVLSNGGEYLPRELQFVSTPKSKPKSQTSVRTRRDKPVNQPAEQRETLASQLQTVTKRNRTIRRNRELRGDEVERIDEQIVFKPRLRPTNTKRAVTTPARFRGNGIVFYD